MRILFFLIISIISGNLQSQESVVYRNRLPWEIERNWGKSKIDSAYFNLPIIKNLNAHFHIRISIGPQIIELNKLSKNEYTGSIVNTILKHTEKSIYSKEIAQEQYASQKLEIENKKVAKIISHLIGTEVLNIPTDTLIPNWERPYVHCGNIFIESNVLGSYSQKRYHCPWNQPDSLQSKNDIVLFEDYLKNELHLDSIYNQFFEDLPQGFSYSKEGLWFQYKMTDDEISQWDKMRPHWEYMNSVKDTLNPYLQNQLESIIDLSSINCRCQFFLKISKKGKLR